MAAASDLIPRTIRGSKTYSVKVKNAVTIYFGTFVAMELSSGFAIPWTGAAGELLLGRALATADPTTAAAGTQGAFVLGATGSTPVPEITVAAESEILQKVSVTGATAITDLGKSVYASDDNVLTLTRPTRGGNPVGVVLRYISSTDCDVLVYSTSERLALTGSGSKELLYLGAYDADTVENGDLRTGIPLPFRGRILTVFAMVDKVIAGVGGTSLINLEIDTVNVTGGVVTVSTAAGGTKGTKLAGTAVTAANTFTEGSVLDVEAASTTDMTAGSFDLYAEVERLPSV